MNITRKQIAYNYSIRRQPIKYIVIHDTGNPSAGADAKRHYEYFNSANRSSSADVFIDDTGVWIVNDYKKYYSWHCGDGAGRYGITNGNSIGVELCINHDGRMTRAIGYMVDFVKQLMAEFNIDASRVVRHYDASRKLCPASMSKNNWAYWQDFKNRISESEDLTMNQYDELKGMIGDLTDTVKELAVKIHNLESPMVYNYIDENMPEWARPTIQKLVDKGILKGDENGLNLTEDLMRILVVNDRSGIYD